MTIVNDAMGQSYEKVADLAKDVARQGVRYEGRALAGIIAQVLGRNADALPEGDVALLRMVAAHCLLNGLEMQMSINADEIKH